MADPIPGAGDVLIELDGEAKVLKPSLLACQTISRMHGGIQAAMTRVLGLDFDLIVKIVSVGLGANPQQEAKLVPELVYRTGMINLVEPCIDFLRVINNGGQPPVEGEEAGAADEAEGPLASPSL